MKADDHPNIIRYFYHEVQLDFVYVAIQLYHASLADIIERPNNFKEISDAFEPKRALHEITSGLRYLHACKIIHRDIKPQNILVSGAKNGEHHRMLISGFGLSMRLEVYQTSFIPTNSRATARAGTDGWRAPEILWKSKLGGSGVSHGRAATPNAMKLAKAVDIFALGCLFYYCLTGGLQLENDWVSIVEDLEELEELGEESIEAVNLMEKMLNPEASSRYVEQRFLSVDFYCISRPDTTSCLIHPFFWNAEQRLAFLQDVSDKFEAMREDPCREEDLVALETNARSVFGRNWMIQLDEPFEDFLVKKREYDCGSVQDLLRALRNGVSRPRYRSCAGG